MREILYERGRCDLSFLSIVLRELDNDDMLR